MDNAEYSVAIIGMAGRFPMADDVEQFWENLKDGRDCITYQTDNQREHFVGAYGRMENIDQFDANFFDVNRAEALDTDPEQRIMMELSYHALEHAGYDSSTWEGKIGMYASFDNGVYVWNNIMQQGRDWYETYQLYKAYLATRCEKIAYKLGFTGPAIMSEYACASSMNAIHQACQSLLNYECDMALAGGVTAEPEQEGYPDYLATESRKGQIRPFDRDADGLVPGSAAGVVVLKRYEDAEADHDNIIAVIRGTFVNNDGNRKAGFAAPSVFGQQECLRSVLSVSEMSPDDIAYYEAHGTGTDLGDSIELRAIKSVIGSRPADSPLYIGSVKSAIGHTNMAAGVTNVIKAALMLQNRMLVPSLHYDNPCSELAEDHCPIKVSTRTESWNGDQPMRAVCSAVGMGGANAMAVLEEPEHLERKTREAGHAQNSDGNGLSQLFLYSGKTKQAAETLRDSIEDYVKSSDVDLAGAAYTLQTGRGQFAHRTFSVMGADGKRIRTQRVKELDPDKKRELVFVFSGVSNFDRTIGKELYETSPVFRGYMDQCFACCEANGIAGIRETFLNFLTEDTKEITAEHGSGIQILFALGYSLGRTLLDLGLKPDRIMGHSNGEYIAAAVSEILSMEDCIRLLKERAALMQTLPEGGMINVAEGEERVRSILCDGVTIGAVNAPNRVMVTGRLDAVDAFEEILKKEDILYSRSPADRASHCDLMEEIADAYGKAFDSVVFGEPQIPVVSTAGPDPASGGREMMEPQYWIRQMCQPVQFYRAVDAVYEDRESIFLEIGTGDALASIIRKVKTGQDPIEAFAIFDSPTAQDARNGFLAALGCLWCAGVSVNWEALYEGLPYKTPLPRYPFERESFWTYQRDLDLAQSDGRTAANAGGAEQQTLAGSNGVAGLFADMKETEAALQAGFFDKETITVLKDIPGYEEDGNRLTAACILEYFRTQPEFSFDEIYTLEKLVHIFGVKEQWIPFLDYFITFLCDYGYAKREFGLIEFLDAAKQMESKEIVLKKCRENHPDCCAYMEFAAYASDHYKEVFSGRREGSTVIYHEGKFDFINSFEARMPRYSYTRTCLKALADVVGRTVHQAERPVRILEIGAGSGEMTDLVLEQLEGCKAEYWFTDIKKSLVVTRQNSEKEREGISMHYEVLDVAENPAEQGFAEHSFDLVLLFDVIQATENIVKTLGNIDALLRDDGACLFVQTCDGSELLNLIYGYAPGWWNYAGDPARQRISMAPEKWREFLMGAGFTNVHSMPHDGASDAYLLMMQPSERGSKQDEISAKEETLDPLEQQLLDIVAEVLGREAALDDNLYELGMDSLMAMMISSKVQLKMHLNLQLADLYGMMTAREIAEFLRTADSKEEEEIKFAEPEKSLEDLFDEL